ncbi:MAG TPA: hypothetical protein VK550_10600 [Polyangiaceae bacterium]|nr:hypothetical protein [Polyangiaceae bacterium]
MSGACFRLLLALGLSGLATLAAAQSKKPQPKFAVPGSPDSAAVAGKEAPSRGRRAPAGRARSDAALATFPGFRLLPDGRSRIYVELTRSVSVDERRAEGVLIYVMHDARVPVRNNRNALITTHFSTPVARARLLSVGADVELIIDLRKSVSATQKVVPGENGSVRLEVDFPAGDYPAVPGLFEPPAAKGQGREAEEPADGEMSPGPSAAPPSPSPSGDNARPAAPASDAPRTLPSATPPSTSPAR